MDWLLYSIFFLALIYLCIIIYIRVKYPFWSFMDANHSYDWFLRRPQKPISLRPCRNKYVVRDQVKTGHSENESLFAETLQRYLIPSDKILYECEGKHIEARMTGHDAQMSFFSHPFTEKPCGVMASYPVVVRDDEPRTVNYISHIAAPDSDVIKKLIATHIYNVHDKTPDIPAFILKKDAGRCAGLRPLATFSTSLFYMGSPNKSKLAKTTTLVQIYKDQWNLVVDAIAGLPGFVVALDIGAIQARVKAGILFVYVLMYRGAMIAMYFIEDAHMLYEHVADHGGKTLRLVATIADNGALDSSIAPLIYSGFQEALAKIIKQNADYKMLLVDSMGANQMIIRYLERDPAITHLTTTTGAYYFVNWAYRDVWESDKVFMLV